MMNVHKDQPPEVDVFLINHVNKLNLLLKLIFSNVLCIIS